MKLKKMLYKLEVVILFLLLYSFVWVGSNELEIKQTYTTERYIDLNATGNNTGVSWCNAWSSFNNIVWNDCIGDTIIYVASGTYSPNMINVIRDNITFESVGNVTITDYNMTNYDPALININYQTNPLHETPDNIQFIKFNFKAINHRIPVIKLLGMNNNEIDNTTFFDCNFQFQYEQAITAYKSNGTVIKNCEFTKTESGNSVLYFFDCINIEINFNSFDIYDNINFYYMSSFIDVNYCQNFQISQNLIVSNSYTIAISGIYLIGSSDVFVANNAIYGSFSSAGIHDNDNENGIEIDCNTIRNTCNVGHGYMGTRTSNFPISSFKNNIVQVVSSGNQNYPMYINGTPAFWNPGYGYYDSVDYNCYYNIATGGCNPYIVYFNTSCYFTDWKSNTNLDTNSIEENPQFCVDEYHLESTTSVNIITGGTSISSIK